MTSSIDPTKPAQGVPVPKADMRANFQAAHDEIVALQSAYGVNVRDFGAGQGGADDGPAFIAAKNAALQAGTREVIVPAGTYQIQTPGALSCDGAGITSGFTWRGAGMLVTIIEYDNSNDDWIIYNDNDQQFVNYVGMSFDGDTSRKQSKFMYSTSASQAQSIRFHDCRWRYWDQIWLLEGTANNSEMVFNLCKIQTNYGVAFTTDNVQAVNHVFINCDLEIMNSSVWLFKQGGHLQVFGGSIILTDPSVGTNDGAVLVTDNPSGVGVGYNNWNFHFFGVRTELRAGAFLIGNSPGLIGLHSCNTYVMLGDLSRVIFDVPDGMHVAATTSTLAGKVVLRAENASSWASSLRPATFTATDCFLTHRFSWEIEDVTNGGGMGKLLIERCKSDDESNSGAAVPLDRYVGWQRGTTQMAATKRIAVLHNPTYTGGLPVGGQTYDLVLPLGSVVTGLRLVHTSQSGPTTQTYILTNADGTQLQSWDLTIGANASTQIATYIRCDTDGTRELQFSGDVGNDSASYLGYLEVEYIA